jgi:ankyrin repeat protein
MVQFLIKAGANVNAEGDGETPLLLAAFYGRPQIAEILLKAGADVNAPGFKDLDPPLNIAAIHGYVDVVKVLLAHGANVNAQNLSHETALDLARQNQQTDVISVLINPPK